MSNVLTNGLELSRLMRGRVSGSAVVDGVTYVWDEFTITPFDAVAGEALMDSGAW